MGEDSDEWLRSAMTDKSMVAEMLIRLSKPREVISPAKLRWGFRQPRSRQITLRGILEAKEEEKRTNSPASPFSFSGGGGGVTSPSGGEGCDVEFIRAGKRPDSGEGTSKVRVKFSGLCSESCLESIRAGKRPDSGEGTSKVRVTFSGLCRERCVDSNRPGKWPDSGEGTSKVVANEASTSRLAIRKAKKKKFDELMEEQNLLLMEKIALDKEMERLLSMCKEMSHKNEILELKLGLLTQTDSSRKRPKADIKTPMLPDLNLPVEDDSEMLYGMS
ncbi:uncharacterized protein LOC143856236 [Tasmannia lanceolata]|uniref:uncharacterized protein LOC143856236 n=1 Tax=Tasmannia lanceolata TaxID=3420 RepID=UPI004062EAE2